jgi:hypothetical protein
MRRALLPVLATAAAAWQALDPRCPSSHVLREVAAAATSLASPSASAATLPAALYGAAREALADGTAVLGLVHPDWQGVRSAHYRVPAFAEHTVELRSFTDPAHADPAHVYALLVAVSAAPALRAIVVDGVLDGTAAFAARLACVRPDVEVSVVFHSGPSSPDHFVESPHIASVLSAARAPPAAGGASSTSKPLIARVGVVKDGFAPFLAAMGVTAHFLPNFPPTDAEAAAALPRVELPGSASGDVVHVGVLGGGGQHKNAAVQVLAACFLPGVVVHVSDPAVLAVEYLQACTAPIVAHGARLPPRQFRALLGSMDVNLHVSLSECFPGTVLESAAAGVPALVAPSSAVVYASDARLAAALVVPEPDNPAAIRAALERVIATLHSPVAAAALRARLCGRLTKSLRRRADAAWGAFLAGQPPVAVDGSGSVATSVASVLDGLAYEAT